MVGMSHYTIAHVFDSHIVQGKKRGKEKNRGKGETRARGKQGKGIGCFMHACGSVRSIE